MRSQRKFRRRRIRTARFDWFDPPLSAVVAFKPMPEENKPIVAAGGIVLQEPPSPDTSQPAPAEAAVPRYQRVLLVHRPKYDDWSFPKGKADEGETAEQTALREVLEETGLACRIIRPLPGVRYTYRGKGMAPTPKIVHYFLMEPASGSLSVNGHEIDLADWFDPDKALEILSYDHDRLLLGDLLRSGMV